MINMRVIFQGNEKGFYVLSFSLNHRTGRRVIILMADLTWYQAATSQFIVNGDDIISCFREVLGDIAMSDASPVYQLAP